MWLAKKKVKGSKGVTRDIDIMVGKRRLKIWLIKETPISSPRLNTLNFTLHTHRASSRHQYESMDYHKILTTHMTHDQLKTDPYRPSSQENNSTNPMKSLLSQLDNKRVK